MLISEIQHKDFNGKSGIYRIHCNSDSYIGSSKNIYYRLRRHLADLRKNKHGNAFLQNLFNKYSEEFVTVEILELEDKLDSVMQILTQGKNRVNCWKSLSKQRSISSQASS